MASLLCFWKLAAPDPQGGEKRRLHSPVSLSLRARLYKLRHRDVTLVYAHLLSPSVVSVDSFKAPLSGVNY